MESYEEKYPPRGLPPSAMVTRFGPSPTGFVHIGSLFTALVSERLAKQSGGVFYLRIEDTDKKREVENGIEGITSALNLFGIKIDEGVLDAERESGNYGPYKQSERKEIYQTFADELLAKGLAYHCFCTPEELEESRKSQEQQKIRPGYYGKWAKHRDLDPEKAKELISQGQPFVIRLKSPGNESTKIPFHDLVKGEVMMTENDQDIVLIKSDGLPTYHFAHVIDDHLMRTTHVIRADEWLPSLPIHYQLFKLLGWEVPKFAHLSPIMKLDGTKRKLSKRKDPEAAVSYYIDSGYPVNSVIEYLINIANSDFEDWRKANPDKPNTDFQIRLEKLNKSGALFDLTKLTDISKDIIARMTAEEVYSETLAWADIYNQSFAKRLSENRDYFLKIFSIERGGENPRKDLSKWSDAEEHTFYFFNDLYQAYSSKLEKLPFPEALSKDEVKKILDTYAAEYQDFATKDEWFGQLKEFAQRLGYPRVGDVAMVLRVAITTKTRTPDLYEIFQVMGVEMVKERLVSIDL